MQPMLTVIDMLADFLEPWAAPKREKLVAAIEALTGAFHGRFTPPMCTRAAFKRVRKNTSSRMKNGNNLMRVPER